jgi:hypothetical protein
MNIRHSILLVNLFQIFQCGATQPVLSSIVAKEGILTVEPSTSLKETFLSNQNFIVNNDRRIQGIPKTVLTVPYLVCISPLLWFSGKSYIIPEMDDNLYHTLEKLKLVLKKFYPKLSLDGRLHPKKLIS